MNFILDKNTKVVLWINQDPKPLTGPEIWSSFNPKSHLIVYSSDYKPNPGEAYKADIVNGKTPEFQAKVVYNISNANPRKILSWEDPALSSNETTVPPLEGENFQSFNGTSWVVDIQTKKTFLKSYSNSLLQTKENSYEGQVRFGGVTYVSSLNIFNKLQRILGPLSRGDVTADAITQTTGGISNIDGSIKTPISQTFLTNLLNAIETNLLNVGASMEATNRSINDLIDQGKIFSLSQIDDYWNKGT